MPALIEAADSARDGGEWALARDTYRQVLDLSPRRAGVWAQYGHALKETGALEEARDAYQAAIDLRPDHADSYVQMAHLARLQGRIGEAASAYVHAVVLDPANRAALEELRDFQRRGVGFDQDAVARALISAQVLDAADDAAPDDVAGTPGLVFDLGDLVVYAREARRPTGIQRVQIGLVSALLASPQAHSRVRLCAFNGDRGDWITLPAALFTAVAEAMEEGDDSGWGLLVDRLSDQFDFGAPQIFLPGDALINLGTSWSTPDYFLHIRRLKTAAAVRYIPFVHDMIPVMAPRYCLPSLVSEFADWVAQALEHADAFLTNSRSSAGDLMTAAQRLGLALSPDRVGRVALNADPRVGGTIADPVVLEQLALTPDGYVLFVSTVEPRKNHLAAIEAWATLVDRLGIENTPPLICVGNAGWLNTQVHEALAAKPQLKHLVRFVGPVADAALAALYEGCAFAFYPSRYEGWGLPVTEALCHGKAVLTSDSSSLPEAGGEFALRFRLDDAADLVAHLERLIRDAPLRRRLEGDIAARFRPRSWGEIARELVDRLKVWESLEPRPAPAPPCVEIGRTLWLRTAPDATLFPGRAGNERLRSGSGWWPLETQGTWTREGGGVIRAPLKDPGGDEDLALEIELIEPPWPSDWTLTQGWGGGLSGRLEAGQGAVITLPLPPAARRQGEVVFTLTGEAGILSETGENRRFAVGLKSLTLRAVGSQSTPSPR